MAAATKPWLVQKFKEILGFDEVEDVVDLVIGMGADDRKIYILQFLGESKESTDFVKEVEERLKGSSSSAETDDFWGTSTQQTRPTQSPAPGRAGLYKKSQNDEDGILTTSNTKNNVNSTSGSRKKKGGKKKAWKDFNEEMAKKAAEGDVPREIQVPMDSSAVHKPVTKPTNAAPMPLPPRTTRVDPPPPSFLGESGKGKAKQNYSAPMAKSGGGKLKFQPYTPGDIPEFVQDRAQTAKCKCMGNEHKPLVNCMSCGRIACQREGWGACNFCKQPLLPVGEGGPLQNTPDAAAAYERAVAMKDKLIEFDRTAASRTKVVDDQGDYYSTSNSSWLTSEEREKIEGLEEERREAVHTRRRDVKVSIDIAGRRVVEQKTNIAETEAKLSEKVSKVLQGGIKNEESAPCQGIEISKQNIKNFGLSGRAKEVYEMLCLDAPPSASNQQPMNGEFYNHSGLFLFSSPVEASSSRKGALKVQHEDDDANDDETLSSSSTQFQEEMDDVFGEFNDMDLNSKNKGKQQTNPAHWNGHKNDNKQSLPHSSSQPQQQQQISTRGSHSSRVGPGGRGGFRGKSSNKKGKGSGGNSRGRGGRSTSQQSEGNDGNASQDSNRKNNKSYRGRNERGRGRGNGRHSSVANNTK